MRAVRPWVITAAACALLVCTAAWPRPTLYAAGLLIGTTALLVGLHLLLEEHRTAARSSTNTGRDCPACHAGLEHTEHCPTPETHNWGCGCPTDVQPRSTP